MALYLIGDIQGCDDALQNLLDKVDFSPSRDTLFLLGDLVNRGPASARVLRRLMHLGPAARCVLGNHDLHLLAVSYGVKKAGRKDTLDDILTAPDRFAMLEWLRHQNMAMCERWNGVDILMVHAGVLPAWNLNQVLSLARECETVLRSPDAVAFFAGMYGNTPAAWSDSLQGMDRIRVIVNALTRLRFCSAGGEMEFDTKDSADAAPHGYLPWFDVTGRRTADNVVAFGHWSTLGQIGRENLFALDTGCVWGGCLSALRLECRPGSKASLNLRSDAELIQVTCRQAQKPG